MTVPTSNPFALLPIEHPSILAPLAGITDAAFRDICQIQGCRFLYAEMVSCEAVIRNNEKADQRLVGLNATVPTIAQILGRDPDHMAQAAQLCEQAGAWAVDINMGCPSRKVTAGGGGSALMRDPDLVRAIVHSVRSAVKVPISVKLRAGWDTDSRNVEQIAAIAEEERVAAIAVHPRTRSQAFRGQADWGVIKHIKALVDVPVIGNGDVKNRDDAQRMMAETGCDAVMVGRAALGAPWIFRLLDDPAASPPDHLERVQIARQHLKLLAHYKGAKRACLEIRKHLAWYLKTLPHHKYVLRGMDRFRDLDLIEQVLDEYVLTYLTD